MSMTTGTGTTITGNSWQLIVGSWQWQTRAV
jgi:hypothetical protein